MRTSSRRTASITAIALGTMAAAVLATPAANAAAPENGAHVNTTLAGTFTFDACPTGTAPGDFCLHDTVTGDLPGAGPVTGSFDVDIHFGAFNNADCGPIDKHGTFTTADGAEIDVQATGVYCSSAGVADYAYVVTGGTAEFRHAHGAGLWHVPAATAYVGNGGYGPETLTGSLHVR